eukprot:comp19270_c0_seq1/m.22088 comp19270_c0_seq1/g.22088  ORF comp19270_c0_seq1/g.22088 comp19270_c0_seq1/m.22088 type:complete len:369 (-) comp19270_c0_seq1:536-1642(-)
MEAMSMPLYPPWLVMGGDMGGERQQSPSTHNLNFRQNESVLHEPVVEQGDAVFSIDQSDLSWNAETASEGDLADIEDGCATLSHYEQPTPPGGHSAYPSPAYSFPSEFSGMSEMTDPTSSSSFNFGVLPPSLQVNTPTTPNTGASGLFTYEQNRVDTSLYGELLSPTPAPFFPVAVLTPKHAQENSLFPSAQMFETNAIVPGSYGYDSQQQQKATGVEGRRVRKYARMSSKRRRRDEETLARCRAHSARARERRRQEREELEKRANKLTEKAETLKEKVAAIEAKAFEMKQQAFQRAHELQQQVTADPKMLGLALVAMAQVFAINSFHSSLTLSTQQEPARKIAGRPLCPKPSLSEKGEERSESDDKN